MPVLLAALILTACGGQQVQQTPEANLQVPANKNSDYYLQQLQLSTDDNKADWQLLAIRALLNEGKYPEASQQLTQLPSGLTRGQQQELQLLNAQVALSRQDMAGAQAALAKLDPSALSADQQARYWQMQIAAQQGRPSLTLLRAYIAQEPLLQGDDHQKNIDATWQTLLQMTPEQMNSLVINADENTLQGWLDLLNVYNANRSDIDMLKASISDWQTRYPNNPGAKTLPTALSLANNLQPASTSKIALLLPLNGQAQVFASAIQKGFNDAKNGVLATTAQPPAPAAQADAAAAESAPSAEGTTPEEGAQPGSQNNPIAADAAVSPSAPDSTAAQDPADAQAADNAVAPQSGMPQVAAPSSATEVKVYDTSSQPLQQVLDQAQQDGATLVVGPLLKNKVEELTNGQTPLNVLALNEPEQIQNLPNLCYFALSPEDEARDAAHHIWQQGKRTPLLLVPRGSLGDRVSNAFAAEWQMLGGGTVLKQQFGSTAELKQGINSGAGISLSGTPVTVQQAQPQSVAIAGLTIPAPAETAAAPAASSGSVDATYIVATQSELQLIKPMIAMRVSSRNNLALYASSRSFQAGAGPDYRLEMEGLQFSDVPLLSGANPALMQQAAKAFNNDYSLVRLYAMGIDAWTLANHFTEMRQGTGFQINGNTGTLSASQDCVINRKLTWSQYRQGQIVPAT